jgi:hypothetical protein
VVSRAGETEGREDSRAQTRDETGDDTEDAKDAPEHTEDDDAAAEADGQQQRPGDREADERDEPVLPPVSAVELNVLFDDYRRGDDGRRPWNWASLPPEHREALVELIDGFADSYNRVWAMSDDQLIPPCWHRHPALAYDLAALVWGYYAAYRGRDASPEAALRFQTQLVHFADRLDRWLGSGARDCRDGQHPRDWRPVRSRAVHPDRDSVEYADEIALLGAEDFGFPGAAAR